MANERLILAIGRIERALSRIEQCEPSNMDAPVDTGLVQKHEKLKSEMRDAIVAIDSLLARKEG